MNQNFVIANRYYRDFEDLSGYVSFRDWRVLGLILSGACFVYSCIGFVTGVTDRQSALIGFGFIVVSEILFLLFWFFTLSLRDKRVKAKFNKKYSWNQSSLSRIKRRRLAELLGCPPQQFLEEAKVLDEILMLTEKYRGPFELTAEQLSQWIYSPESRARLLTLLVFLASAVTVLSVREEANLSSIFRFYGPADWDLIGAVYFFMILAIALSLGAAAVIFKAFIYVAQIVSWRLDGKKSNSPHIVRYMVNDLVRHYRRPSIKPNTARNGENS